MTMRDGGFGRLNPNFLIPLPEDRTEGEGVRISAEQFRCCNNTVARMEISRAALRGALGETILRGGAFGVIRCAN
jgi:hypothetical protein